MHASRDIVCIYINFVYAYLHTYLICMLYISTQLMCFYIFQAYRHVLNGYYPSSEDAAIYLAGILLAITHGDYNKAMHTTEFLK